MHLSSDPDFEEFALDCIRLSNQGKSPILRGKLLTLAREWMTISPLPVPRGPGRLSHLLTQRGKVTSPPRRFWVGSLADWCNRDGVFPAVPQGDDELGFS